MHQKLPIEIDPFRLAKSGLILEGELPLKVMRRLSEVLHDDHGSVHVKMNFDVDKVLGTPYVHGEFTASLSLICERCSEPMQYKVNVQCSLAMVSNERKIESLAEQYEPWVIDNDNPVILSSIVEDELILAIPLIPKHDHSCLPAEAWFAGEEIEEGVEKKVSPFAVLAALKSKD
ncbi:MAG: DNA-binding protein [Methylophaga sp.]|nr:DNA-binding protein [Methylophaga sp.]